MEDFKKIYIQKKIGMTVVLSTVLKIKHYEIKRTGNITRTK